MLKIIDNDQPPTDGSHPPPTHPAHRPTYASSTFAAEPLLNGQQLRAEQAGVGSVPSLTPRIVPPPADEASPLLTVGPLSVNFFAFPNARLPVCLQRLEKDQHM